MTLNLDALPLSRKQIVSIVESPRFRISIWAGAVRSGKTVASLLAFLMAVAEAPSSGLILITGRSLQTIERNIFDPLADPALFGDLTDQVHHTAGSSTAVILSRTVHLIGASDARAEGRLRGLTACLALVDEATLLPQAFWTQLLARLSVPNARILATTNPDNPSHWLRKDFILRESELDLRHWHFTLNDNPSLTPEYVAALKAENVGLWFKRRVLGLWVQAEGAVYDMWDPDVHVVDLMPPIHTWVCIGLDYGTSAPTAAVLLGLSRTGGGEDGSLPCLYFVDEWRWDSRQRHRQLTDVELSANLRQWLNSVRFPGTRLHGPQPRYLVIDPSAASLKVQCYQDGWPVMDADNSVLDGIRLVSSLLTKQQLKVSRSCTGWIDEIGGYAWDDAAAMKGEDKPVKADDHCLAAGTLVATTRGEVPIEDVHAGDQVMTRDGWRAVTDAWQVSPAADVMTLETSDGRRVTGTPNHRIWTANRGWVRMDAVRYGDILVTWPHLRKQSSTRVDGTAATQRPRGGLSGPISYPASVTGRSTGSAVSTRRSGKIATGRSRMAATSTMTTTTRSTTSRATWSASPAPSTRRSTVRNGASGRAALNGSLILRRSARSPRRGTPPMRVSNGIASMASGLWKPASRPPTSASGAVPRTRRFSAVMRRGSAQTAASQRGAGHRDWTTNNGPVAIVAASSPSTATQKPSTAAVRVVRSPAGERATAAVYDLTVDDAHEFFANGILVHNSLDAGRYAIKTTQGLWRSHVRLAGLAA